MIGLDPDIARCVSAGKSMIVEGVHVRPSWTQRIAERHESAANGGDMETKCSDHDTNPKSNTSIAAVVISFLLVAEHDVALHTRRIEEWLGRRCDYEGNVTTVCDKAIANIRAVQAKLLEEATPATIIIDTTVGADESAAKSRCSTADSVAVISPEESSTFVLNRMHDEILDRITAHMSGRSL